MGRDAVALIALAGVMGCPRAPEGPAKMRDPRVLEVAQSCARKDHEAKGAGGCALLLDEATIDDAKRPDGAHVFIVEFREERCGKPRFKAGLVLEIDDAGTCTRVGP